MLCINKCVCVQCLLVSPTFETRTPPQSAFDDDDGGAANGGSGGFGNDLSGFVTKTVTGFLDFTTTVGNTVMVFTPEGGKRKTGKDYLF